ncbi:Chitin synthase regulator [Trichinella spiralis]|uniref:Chitin synthase regulator n=1 Tax=Trichinella spiralis TaxID=6334 RepID=A0ABR3KQY9_TRISP
MFIKHTLQSQLIYQSASCRNVPSAVKLGTPSKHGKQSTIDTRRNENCMRCRTRKIQRTSRVKRFCK